MKKFIAGMLTGLFTAILFVLSSTVWAGSSLDIKLLPVSFSFNGEKKELPGDYAALHYNGHIYAPIRYIAENVKAGIAYNEHDETVTVLQETKDKLLLKAVTDNGTVYVRNLAFAKEIDMPVLQGEIMIDPAERLWGSDYTVCIFDLTFLNSQGKEIPNTRPVFTFVKRQDLGKVTSFNKMIVNDELKDADIHSARLHVTYLDRHPVHTETPPLPVVQTANGQAEVIQATYCWRGCGEYGPARDLIERVGTKPTEVTSGEKITVSLDYDPQPQSFNLSRYIDGKTYPEPVEFKDRSFTAPVEKGVYVYTLSAFWYGGDSSFADSSYAFTLRVN